MVTPLHDLKTDMYALQIKRINVANYCNLSYSQLSNHLNGITSLTYTFEKKIREYIHKRRTEIEKVGAK